MVINTKYYNSVLNIGFNSPREPIYDFNKDEWLYPKVHLGRLVYGNDRIPYTKIKENMKNSLGTGGSKFKIKLSEDWAKTSNNSIQVEVISNPTLTTWSKIKKFFGFAKNLVYKYNVKLV